MNNASFPDDVKATTAVVSPEPAVLHLVALIGGPGSGKTTVAEYLSEKGYAIYSISDIRRVAALVSSVEPNDFEAMSLFTDEFYAERGRGIFAEYALRNIASRRPPRVVLEGLRYPESIEVTRDFCKKEGWRLLCIGLRVPPELAATRIATRDRPRDPQSPDRIHSYAVTAGRKSDAAFEYCDAVVPNDRSIEDLLVTIDGLVRWD